MEEYLIRHKDILESLQYLCVIIGTLTLIVGFFLTISQLRQNRNSLKHSSDTVQAQFALEFMKDYGKPEMSESLRLLRKCKEDFKDDCASVWHKKLIDGDSSAKEIDKARRHVKFYYRDIYMLYKEKLITLKVFKLACFNAGINLLYDVVNPMGDEIDSAQERFIDDMKNILGYHGTEVKPIPPSSSRKSEIIVVR